MTEIEHLLVCPSKQCRPDQAKVRAGLKPVRPRCLVCRQLLAWGERYRATVTSRAKGVVIHEKCVRDALELSARQTNKEREKAKKKWKETWA